VITAPGTTTVAGRDAYQLVLAPRDTASLVGQVRIAIDAARHFPLRVQIYAAEAADPAFEVGFTQVSLDRPDAGQFRFTPPPGTTVEEQALPEGDEAGAASPDRAAARLAPDAKDRPEVIGTGWTAVMVARDAIPDGAQDETAGQLLATLPAVDGSWGSGRLLRSSLFSVLITDDGRVLAGLVAPQTLYAAAERTGAGS
jgi:hypothetical protein